MSDRVSYRAIPEAGQLVEVRGRCFSVADVRTVTTPDDPFFSGMESDRHLLVLSSVEALA